MSLLLSSLFCTILSSHIARASPVMLESIGKSETLFNTESFQILHGFTSSLVFSSPHRFVMGFRSGDWNAHVRSLIVWSVNHFIYFFIFVRIWMYLLDRCPAETTTLLLLPGSGSQIFI